MFEYMIHFFLDISTNTCGCIIIKVNLFFKDYLDKKKRAKDVIKLSLEKLEINSKMRRS